MSFPETATAADVLAVDPLWRDVAVCTQEMHWTEYDLEDQLDDCRTCPVVRECLAHAIATGQTEVVQGGLSIGTKPLRRITMVDGNGTTWTVQA